MKRDPSRKLRPYQRVGVKQIERFHGRALLADEQGLGKTAQVLRWLEQHPKVDPVVVVCPAVAKWVWRDEARLWTGRRCQILNGRQARRKLRRDRIIVVNYDILGAWLPKLLRLQPRTIILDEAHYISNPKSQRFAFVEGLVFELTEAGERIRPQIPHRILVTGTPFTNRAAELWPLLSILLPKRFASRWKFYWSYTCPRRTRWGWIYKGARRAKQLHELLVKQCMIRRTKDEVAKDLPPKTRAIVPVSLPKRMDYDFAAKHFIRWLKEIDTKAARRAKKAVALTKIGYLLELAAQLKWPLVREWIDTFLADTSRKLVVFTRTTGMMSRLRKRYKGHPYIDGSVKGAERAEMIRRFQQDPKERLIFVNQQAGGIAITLHAASDGLMVELPRSAGMLVQVEDRLHRIGQAQPVTVTYLVARRTLEEDVLAALQLKLSLLEKVIDGRKRTASSLALLEEDIVDHLFRSLR